MGEVLWGWPGYRATYICTHRAIADLSAVQVAGGGELLGEGVLVRQPASQELGDDVEWLTGDHRGVAHTECLQREEEGEGRERGRGRGRRRGRGRVNNKLLNRAIKKCGGLIGHYTFFLAKVLEHPIFLDKTL